MTDPVGPARPVDAPAAPGPAGDVSADRKARFASAMIAAAMRPPMINLAGANGGPDEPDPDPAPIPMRAPIIPP